jgi:hypothetical protein
MKILGRRGMQMGWASRAGFWFPGGVESLYRSQWAGAEEAEGAE